MYQAGGAAKVGGVGTFRSRLSLRWRRDSGSITTASMRHGGIPGREPFLFTIAADGSAPIVRIPLSDAYLQETKAGLSR